VDLKKNKKDFRPESHSPINIDNPDSIHIIDHIDTSGDWERRKQFVRGDVRYDLKSLIAEAKDEERRTSLAVFKPAKIKDFVITKESRDWEPDKIAWLKQYNLFENRTAIIRKLPYKFSYVFEDSAGYESTLMIEDWEIGALFWTLLRKNEGDEKAACQGVKQKYFDDFPGTKDIFFFLGTNFIHHVSKVKNPFIIVGLFYPPRITQLNLDLPF